MEPLLVDMRMSRVEPTVEGNLVQLVDMVKQMGRKGNLTESQNRKMVGYMGDLDDMRHQLVIMIQRYEDDSKVLKRLLELVDRIDDVKALAINAEESKGTDGELMTDQDIAKAYDTPFNPLMVSTLNILDVSGLFASKILGIEEEEEEEEDEEDDDSYWDHHDDPALVAEESAPSEVTDIKLSDSNLFLPSLFDSCDNLPNMPPLSFNATLHPSSTAAYSPSVQRAKIDTVINNLSLSDANLPSLFDSTMRLPFIPLPPPLPTQQDKKGKGKAQAKGKAKVSAKEIAARRKAVTFKDCSTSESDYSGSDDESLDGAQELPKKPTIGWKRTVPAGTIPTPPPLPTPKAKGAKGMARPSASTASSSSSARPINVSASETESESEEETESESESSTSRSGSSSSSEEVAPSSSKAKGKAARRRRGPCDSPVLCKICYEEYDRWEKVHQFQGCEHAYCRECLRDYLATNITDGAVLDLTCPYPECQTEFPPTDIKFLCTAEIWAKFERFTLLAALRADPNARWCPNPYCNNGIKHNASTMPWVFCNACKFEFCFHCMAERHDGAACGQEALAYLQKKHESELAATNQFTEWTELMKSFVKPCPGCKAFIEKNDGCNHMTCQNPSCRTQFCWLCLNLYTGDHFVDDINFPDCYDKQYWTPPDILVQSAQIARQAAVIPRRRRFANIAKKVGIYMGVGVAVVTLGVPAAVIGGPVYGCFKLHKRLKARRNRNNWVPPTQARIEEARREAQRLYELEHS